MCVLRFLPMRPVRGGVVRFIHLRMIRFFEIIGRRTRVHRQDCHTWGGNAGLDCECPKRLVFGTIDSPIGKLRAIFAESGRGAEW